MKSCSFGEADTTLGPTINHTKSATKVRGVVSLWGVGKSSFFSSRAKVRAKVWRRRKKIRGKNRRRWLWDQKPPPGFGGSHGYTEGNYHLRDDCAQVCFHVGSSGAGWSERENDQEIMVVVVNEWMFSSQWESVYGRFGTILGRGKTRLGEINHDDGDFFPSSFVRGGGQYGPRLEAVLGIEV